MPPLKECIAELVVANHVLANEDVLDGFGHISMRAPDDPATYFLSRARAPELVDEGDIVRFRLDSEPLEGEKRSYYSERVIHGEIYKARPDVMAVCHHHAPAVMPFCIAKVPLRPVTHLGATIGAEISMWDSQDEFGDTNLLVAKPEEGRSLAQALGDNFVVLMRRHGATVAGRTVREAVFRCIYLANNARTQLAAMQLGDYETLTPGEIAMSGEFNLRSYAVDRAWERWAMRAARRG
ncbi:MAG TPA: class II aldolase/adducin family protein [Pseudolabrys sp.]|nr:class II aldolase/adducin family protein [Pseudolabrys sp.]